MKIIVTKQDIIEKFGLPKSTEIYVEEDIPTNPVPVINRMSEHIPTVIKSTSINDFLHILYYVASYQRLQAIKELRERSYPKLSLKEAKDCIDLVFEGMNLYSGKFSEVLNSGLRKAGVG